MEQNYLRRVIRKNARTPLLISLIFVLVFLAGSIRESEKWSTLFTPLAEKTSAEGIKDLQKQGKYYFQLKNADVYFLDYAIYSYDTVNGVKSSEEKLSQIYGILAYDDGYLLTLLPKKYMDMSEEELASVTAVANLESIDSDKYHREAYNEMITALSDAYSVDSSVIKENVAEICVTIPENGRLDDQILSVIFILGFIFSFLYFLYQLLILFNYKLSKFYKKLAKTGSPEDIEYSINHSVEKETFLYINTLKSANNTGLITSDYIIGKKGMSLALGNTRDLVWAHLKLIRHKTYFITVRKTYQVLFYFKGVKTPLFINCNKEDDAANLLGLVAERLGVYSGYSDELAKLYSKNYDAFIREVENWKAERNRADAYEERSEYDNSSAYGSQTENSREESNAEENNL